jgi:hypothetical protein
MRKRSAVVAPEQGSAPPEPVVNDAPSDVVLIDPVNEPERKPGWDAPIDRTPGREGAEVHTVGQLEAAIAEIVRLKGDAAASGWRLGRAIHDLEKRGLWKLSLPRYKSFDGFCNGELSMSPKHAHTLMDVAANYTEDAVRAWGTTKLGLVLTAPPADQPRLQARVEQGAPKREIERAVVEAKAKAQHQRPARDGSARKPPAPKKLPSKQIAIANLLGSVTIKLYAKPEGSMKGVDITTLVRAKKAADAIGRLELVNDLVMLFQVVQDATTGELRLKIATKQDDGE